MTPDFRIVANGLDATARFQDRLLSIEVIDEDGDKADRVTITVDDRDGRVARPSMDARLEVWLGWRGEPLAMMGVYAVDSLAGEGPLQTMTIGATAADMKGPIRAPRTRAWEDKSLGDIVAEIAAASGLIPRIAPALAAIRWPYLAQTAESDLHFVARLARGLDATAKPAGGHLVVQPRGAAETAAGDPMPNLTLSRRQLSSWSWSIDTREDSKGFEAEYTDPDTGTRKVVAKGSGETVTRLRHAHASKAEAQRAVDSAARRAATSGLALSAELAGFFPGAVAGARLTLDGLRPDLDGAWHLKLVRHSLGGGALATSLEAERGIPA